MEYPHITDDLSALLNILPPTIADAILGENKNSDLLEVVLDLGRMPTARFLQEENILGEADVGRADIDAICAQISTFDDDKRAAPLRPQLPQ